jgi:signal transduction histidine kinase
MLNVTHDFRVENGAGALPLLGDEDRLVQVVFNLLENAVKYAGDGPVEIRLKKEDSGRPARAVLEIEDHGPGMPPEELASIFERFHQASGPSSHRRGLGLGLFIARDVVSQHGGSIQAQSSIGRGSVFTIRLPLADRSEPAAAGSGE